MPLQHLDLVAIGILDEKESGHQSFVAKELFDVIRLKAELSEPPVLGVQVIHSEGDVTIARAMAVSLRLVVVEGEF